MEIDLSLRVESESFKMGLEIIKVLRVANDTVERPVNPIEDYNNILTKHENHKEYIFQIQNEKKKKNHDANKRSIKHL